MLPVNYWGKTTPMKANKNKPAKPRNEDDDDDDDEEDEQLDENIYEFEEKIISTTRSTIEAETKSINLRHMGFEDKLAATIRLKDKRNFLMQETRKWKKKNGGPHKRLMNFFLRKQVEAITPFDEKQSLFDLEAAVARLRFLKERLPSQNMPGGWTR
mmetsp:Transcript_22022/g.37292  ORF Transcript_22022/g.37292 Transcript_22022/m.37292 type:complete len:157 (+) Transcript_22022:56-526(+)